MGKGVQSARGQRAVVACGGRIRACTSARGMALAQAGARRKGQQREQGRAGVVAAPAARGQRARRCVAASAASVEDLEREFGLKGSVKFEAGEGGLPKAVLTHVCGASCEVYLYGANILSWKQASGDEVLYVRPDAKFDKTKAISGGIPICFPQFGPGDLRQHGFARDAEWSVGATSADYNPDDKDPCVELILEDGELSRECGFPHPFRVSYSVTLHRETLQVSAATAHCSRSIADFRKPERKRPREAFQVDGKGRREG